jgi:hypothetical protein
MFEKATKAKELLIQSLYSLMNKINDDNNKTIQYYETRCNIKIENDNEKIFNKTTKHLHNKISNILKY